MVSELGTDSKTSPAHRSGPASSWPSPSNREQLVNTAHESADGNPEGPLGNAARRDLPGGAFGGILRASASARFAIAIVLSTALWTGYFWAVASLSQS